MSWPRRDFLITAGLGTAAGTVMSCQTTTSRSSGLEDWDAVRACFGLDPGYVHLAGLLMASHPAPVRQAIETRSYARLAPGVYNTSAEMDLALQSIRDLA